MSTFQIKVATWFILVCIAYISVEAQTVFEHIASSANTASHITTLNNAATNNKSNVIILVTQAYGQTAGVYNPNEIGVWYDEGKWKIFNQNKKPMPPNAKFNVLVTESLGEVHTTTAANTAGHITTLARNYGANACLLITQRYGKYNTSATGVWYSAGKWKIYNEDRSPIPVGTQFNILYLQEHNGLKFGEAQIPVDVFQHKVASNNRDRHISHLNKTQTNDQAGKKLFVTQRWVTSYNPHVTGVWYDIDKKKWAIYNQDKAPMPENVIFNVFAFTPKSQVVLNRKRLNPDVLKATQRGLKVDPGKLVIRPYPTKTGQTTTAPSPENKDIQGPNLTEPPHALSTIISDAQYSDFLSNLNLFREIYEDKNKAANTFYYLPASYNMYWHRDNKKYSFFIYYLSATAAGERGDVIITAEFSPNINEKDVLLAEQIISKKLNRSIKLLPLPLKEEPTLDFGNNLLNFGVKSETITIKTPTDFLQPIVVSWKMDQRVDDLLGAMMSQVNISGNVKFLPYAAEDKVISVPVKLKINDSATFGKFEYDNAGALLNGFDNQLDFPLVLKQVNVMRSNAVGTATFDAIPLANYEVAPNTIFSTFSTEEKNKILNGNPITKIWLNYGVSDCQPCNQSVMQKILGGTDLERVKKITVEAQDLISYVKDSLDGNYVKIRLKSKQGDPNGKSELVLPSVDIHEDHQIKSVGELFSFDNTPLSYSYQVFIILNDGTVLEGPWDTGETEFIILGSSQLSKWFKTN